MFFDFNIVNFNCWGYKSSSSYVEELCKRNDIVFLNEHWLKPYEMCNVQSYFKKLGFWTYFKSSMDPEKIHYGRSYGGLGFICKPSANNYISFRQLHYDSDRICSIQIIHNSVPLLTVIGVYMPFYNGSKENMELYIELLDVLQSLAETYSDTHLMFCGDFNTALPQKSTLCQNWYKQKPFNHYSLLLHDFMYNNNLLAANFNFKQNINYTYFKGQDKTYIDHVLVPGYYLDSVSNCVILNEHDQCTSDHYPIKTMVRFSLKINNMSAKGRDFSYPKPDWNNVNFKKAYSNHVKTLLDQMYISTDEITCKHDAENYVNEYCNNLRDALHDAVAKSNNDSTCNKKRKQHWWNQSCKVARNRLHFWFSLWKSCGRPRHGAVFDSYKNAKYLFRRVCRKAVNNNIKIRMNNCDNLFLNNNSHKLWNLIKRQKNLNNNNSSHNISRDELEKYFKLKFGYNKNSENDFIKKL